MEDIFGECITLLMEQGDTSIHHLGLATLNCEGAYPVFYDGTSGKLRKILVRDWWEGSEAWQIYADNLRNSKIQVERMYEHPTSCDAVRNLHRQLLTE